MTKRQPNCSSYMCDKVRRAKQASARLRRKVRRLALAWNVHIYTRGGESVFSLLGKEQQVMAWARVAASTGSATRWKTDPFPEFNHMHEGRLARAACGDWRLAGLGEGKPSEPLNY